LNHLLLLQFLLIFWCFVFLDKGLLFRPSQTYHFCFHYLNSWAFYLFRLCLHFFTTVGTSTYFGPFFFQVYSILSNVLPFLERQCVFVVIRPFFVIGCDGSPTVPFHSPFPSSMYDFSMYFFRCGCDRRLVVSRPHNPSFLGEATHDDPHFSPLLGKDNWT